MLNRRSKIILGIVLPVGAIALIFGALIAMSAYAIKSCTSSCVIVESSGVYYRLTGEAYKAWLDLDNRAAPMYKMRYESQYIDDRPYLINIDGPSPAVEEIVSKYDVIKNSTKVASDNHWTSFYGWIYKDNLVRFLNENSVDSLSSKSVSVFPVGGVTDERTTVYGIPPQIPDMDQFVAERQTFIQNETSKIISEKAGVERIWIWLNPY